MVHYEYTVTRQWRCCVAMEIGDVGESFLDAGCLLCHSVTVAKPVVKRSYNSRLAFDWRSTGDRLAIDWRSTGVRLAFDCQSESIHWKT